MVADFIEMFLEYNSDISSPPLFRLWSGITALAGALERRCWVRTRKGAIFPNMLVILVSTPGVGKSEAIKPTEMLWRECKNLYVSPKSLTSASLIDTLSQSERVVAGEPSYEFHSLQIPLTEFGTLVTAYDMAMLNIINDIYDCPPVYSEKRRHFNEGEELSITNPQITILAGTQPGFLAKIMPEEAWSMGFTSRLLMIYSGVTEKKGSLWGGNTNTAEIKPRLLRRIEQATQLNGQFTWTDAASAAMDAWYQADLPPVPQHSKLVNYVPRRPLHAIKLCMVSGLSRSGKLEIDVDDVERAMLWLTAAESAMPQIFREMTQKSDADVINELHFALWRIWVPKQEPIHESLIYAFLQQRCPADKIPGIISLAEKARFLQRATVSNEHWIPLPKQQHGME